MQTKILETPDFTVEAEIDFDHPNKPLIEIRIVSDDSVLAEEFHTDQRNLRRISKFFEKIAEKADRQS